VCNRKISGHI